MGMSRRIDDTWPDRRAEHERPDMARVLWWVGALIPGHDDHPVVAEGRRGLDPRDLARKEGVEVTDGIPAARVMAVLAVVGYDQVELAHGAAGERGVEGSRGLRAGPAHRQVVSATRGAQAAEVPWCGHAPAAHDRSLESLRLLVRHNAARGPQGVPAA